jgi:thymidylate synthase (FAD)
MNNTHVEVPTDFTQPIIRIPLNNDNIGYLEAYDFSRANTSEASRIACISTVASVCYGNPKAAGSISLYNRLANESAGLPSSSFEFVPVLLHSSKIAELEYFYKSSIKFGEYIIEDSQNYLLTNLRALIADVGAKADQYFNTEEECAIIAKHHKVFKAKIDIATRTQYIRHRVSWQELSRRYVSGNRAPFEFYVSPKLKVSIDSDIGYTGGEGMGTNWVIPQRHIEHSVQLYDAAIANGVKPEEARRILPQAMYTTIWSAWLPSQLESFYTLRLDSHAQSEIRELAKAMKTATPSKC